MSKVNYNDLIMDRVTLEFPINKQSKPEPGKQKGVDYIIAKFAYLYQNPNGSFYKDDLSIELCEVNCTGMQYPHDNYRDYQIQIKFDQSKPEVVKCLSILDNLHARMIDLIVEKKMPLKAKGVDATLAKNNGTGCKKLVHFAEDKATGERDLQRNPSQFIKLLNYNINKSLFLVPGQKDPVDWNIISKSKYSGIPLIKYAHVYSNGTGPVSIKYNLESMLLTDIALLGNSDKQLDTAQNLVESGIASKVSAGMADVIARLTSDTNKTIKNDQPKNELPKSEPITSAPTDLTAFMRSGPTQIHSGPIHNNEPSLPQVQQATTQPSVTQQPITQPPTPQYQMFPQIPQVSLQPSTQQYQHITTLKPGIQIQLPAGLNITQ